VNKSIALVPLLCVLVAACSSDNGGADKTTQASCATQSSPALSACWTKVAPEGSGGFPDDPGSFDTPKWEPGKFPLGLKPVIAFNDELWMTGRLSAWSSPDGLTWTKHDKADSGERIYQTYAFFKGKLWFFGGLEYQSRQFLNDIWSSADGEHWENVGNAGWSPRSGATVIAFQDKLWLFGGANHAAQDRSSDGFLNDVWASDDGLKWTQVTGAAPWAARDYANVVLFNDELYLLGGQGQADVWSSKNGKDWTQLTLAAPWKERQDYAALVFDGNMWVFGGWAGKSTNALNDVWYSENGTNWLQQTEHAPWTPRDPVSIVYKDKIWTFGGKHTGANPGWAGDIWTMSATPAAQ